CLEQPGLVLLDPPEVLGVLDIAFVGVGLRSSGESAPKEHGYRRTRYREVPPRHIDSLLLRPSDEASSIPYRHGGVESDRYSDLSEPSGAPDSTPGPTVPY